MFDGMRDAAKSKGWALNPANPGMMDVYGSVTLTGEEEDVLVRLERLAAIHQFSTTAYLRPALPFSLSLRFEGVRGAIAHLLGMHDLEVGDANFDKTFRIVASEKDADAVRKVLTPEVRELLFALSEEARAFGNAFSVTEAAVNLSRQYMMPMSEDEVLLDVTRVVGVARAMKQAAQGLYR